MGSPLVHQETIDATTVCPKGAAHEKTNNAAHLDGSGSRFQPEHSMDGLRRSSDSAC